METAVCNEKPNSQSEKEYSEKLTGSMNNALLEEPSVNISANLPLTEALPAVLPKRQRKRARSSGAKVINNFNPVQSLDILVNPVESQNNVQRSHAPNIGDSDLCCLKGTLSVENITPEKKNCVQSLGRDEHHNDSLGTEKLMDEPSMSIISDLVPAELPPLGGLTNRKRKKKDTIGVALESENSCPESCAVICTGISEKEEQQEDLFHERKKKRRKQDKRHKIHESDDKNCDISVGTSLAETIMPTVDHSVEPSVVDFPEQVEQVAMAQPPMEGIGTNENSKIAEPIEDLSSSRKKKKKTQKKSKTQESIDESCGNDRSCKLSVGISLVENIMPGRDPPQQPPVSESSEQKLELPQPLTERMNMKINSESSEPIQDLSSSRKKKKKTQKKSETRESNDESCGNDKSCELSVGISLGENIMPGRDPPQQPSVSESSEQKLELPQPLTERMNTKINSESSEPIQDLSSSRKKKKKTRKKSETRESSEEKSCELSVGISLVENIMPGRDLPQQPPVSESSKQMLEFSQPLLGGMSMKINSESSEPIEDLTSSSKKKKKARKKSETWESNDESCGNDKSCELSVGISLVENIMPGRDLPQQPPVSESSKQMLELPQPLMGGMSTKINPESSEPIEDLTSSRKKKKKARKKSETWESNDKSCGNDKSCELSVGISLVENIMPGVHPPQQPPVSESSKQKLELPQPLMEGISAKINSESSEPIEDLSSSRKKKKKNPKKNSETRESNDKSCELSVGISLVESIMPVVDPSQQPPVSESSEQKLELLQPLMEGINAKINSESSGLVEDLSSSRKKKKKTQKKRSEAQESNDESCGNDKSGEFSVGSSLVENIVPGVDLSQKPPVSESSEQKLELPQSLMDGISTKINSESSEPIGDLSSSRKKKKKFKTQESNDKSCELSVSISFVENFMPGIDPSQQPPDSEFSEEKLDLPQPLVKGNSAAASSEGPKSLNVDLSCSQEQKKKRKRRHKTNECIDERCDLSVGTSLGGNTFPGVDLTVQPPLAMFSKQDLEVEKPLVEGIKQRINSESIELIEVLSCSQGRKDRKKRLKMRKSNDTSSDPSVGTSVEKIIPGADPSPQPPVAVVSDLHVIQLLLEESTLQEKNEDKDQNKRSNASGNNNTNHQVCAGFPGQVDLGAVVKEGSCSQIPYWAVERPLVFVSWKKLLILDVNGLLADIVQLVPQQMKLYKPDKMIARKSVFKRPFYDSFLLFCLDYFNVAIWSSRNKKNVDAVVDYLLGISKKKLLFCWNQSHCTKTKFKTLDNKEKPLVFKELRKLWEKHDPDLPFARGEYNETNTLLVDDSPYKALCNPENTAIFPFPYRFKNRTDRSLGVGGDLRRYVEGLVYAPNVQEYVKHNRFGQRPITKKAKSWKFYSQVLRDQAQSPKN